MFITGFARLLPVKRWVRDRGRGVFLPNGEVEVLEGFISDVTDRKESEKQIQRQVQRFEALRKIDIAITASLDQRVTFDILLDQVTTQLVWMLPLSSSTTLPRMLEFAAGRGFRTAIFQHTRLRLSEKVMQASRSTEKPSIFRT